MFALTIEPGKGNLHLDEIAEPSLDKPTQVKLRVCEVGICGTDREEVVGGRADAPPGHQRLVIGHEMIGEVIAKGSDVTKVKVGDYAVISVRRGCGKCVPCLANRSDMCATGLYTERGIRAADGYDAEYVVDDEQYLVKVPESIRSVGVLTEPMSVAQKAIDEALAIQAARLPEMPTTAWIEGKRALVAGLGAIGMLAAVALALRGAKVTGLDIVDANNRRASLLKKLGASYIDSRKVKPAEVDDAFGEFDFIFEATGVAEVGFNLIDALGTNGIYVMTGIPHGNRPVCFPASAIMTQMVLKNQIVIGSVNAGPKHFRLAIDDLERAKNRWGDVIDEIITTRLSFMDFEKAIDLRSDDDIKTVIEWKRALHDQ